MNWDIYMILIEILYEVTCNGRAAHPADNQVIGQILEGSLKHIGLAKKVVLGLDKVPVKFIQNRQIIELVKRFQLIGELHYFRRLL